MAIQVFTGRLRQRFSTLAVITEVNPILLEGEVWIEKHATTGRSTGRRKVGDGVVSGDTITGTAFDDLPFEPGGAGSEGPPGPEGPAGATGPQGPQGETGPTGATGPQGPAGATGPQGPQGDPGAAGATGSTGATGAAGPGVPAGGTTNQVLRKINATDYNTEWADPTGGGTDQPLYFDAAEFIPRTTNGCGVSSEETSTNRINSDLLQFVPTRGYTVP
jgi:hypothetical protein